MQKLIRLTLIIFFAITFLSACSTSPEDVPPPNLKELPTSPPNPDIHPTTPPPR